ncbi:MAG TPA: NUDIX domain-containing protein [Sandaracinaceae bacterium LLY-WYZ-13_1]|nr:NUDIX domain-containing protein [Sandaracinaceae bacterium LLY-WYZ-13_1]
MPKRSAGILPVRRGPEGLQVLLVHPGGPFFRSKDDGSWSVAKGLLEPGDEDELAAARRELREETGFEPPGGPYVPLGEVRQKSGKRVVAWAVVADFDPAALESNRFELEWPPRSGRTQSFPEVDRAAWFDPDTARRKVLAAQAPFLDRLAERAGELFGDDA